MWSWLMTAPMSWSTLPMFCLGSSERKLEDDSPSVASDLEPLCHISLPSATPSSLVRAGLLPPSIITATPFASVFDAKIVRCWIFRSFPTKFLYEFNLSVCKFPVRSAFAVFERPDSKRSVATVPRSPCANTPFRSPRTTMLFSPQLLCIEFRRVCSPRGFALNKGVLSVSLGLSDAKKNDRCYPCSFSTKTRCQDILQCPRRH